MKTITTLITGILLVIGACNVAPKTKKPKTNQNATSNFEYRQIKIGNESAAEISAYNEQEKILLVLNGQNNTVAFVDLNDIENPKLLQRNISLPAAPNSIDTKAAKVAVAVVGKTKQDTGMVLIYDLKDASYLKEYRVGYLPDMVKITPDGKYILSANEGEPNDDFSIDPEGSVSIIDLQTDSVVNLYFTDFVQQKKDLLAKGYHLSSPSGDFLKDIEPEYIAVSPDSKYAWVSLQENNAVAKLDIQQKQITNIFPLGFVDNTLTENAFDASDKDNSRELKNWPTYSMFQPDGIASFQINGVNYFATANEGEPRFGENFEEAVRVKDLELDSLVFPNRAELQQNENLGRLFVSSILANTDDDPAAEQLFAFGTRSFSIWDGQTGRQVFDSQNSIEKITNNHTKDNRSDKGGASPEGIAGLQVSANKALLAVGLEYAGGALLYEITDATRPVLVEWLNNPADVSPEGVLILSAKTTSNDKYAVILSNEKSGTVSIYFPKNEY